MNRVKQGFWQYSLAVKREQTGKYFWQIRGYSCGFSVNVTSQAIGLLLDNEVARYRRTCCRRSNIDCYHIARRETPVCIVRHSADMTHLPSQLTCSGYSDRRSVRLAASASTAALGRVSQRCGTASNANKRLLSRLVRCQIWENRTELWAIV